MWRVRLFGKMDLYKGKDYEDKDLLADDIDQWTSVHSINFNTYYNSIDGATIRTTKEFPIGKSVILAYANEIGLFGYVEKKNVITAGAEYEYYISEYLNDLDKYAVPRAGATTFDKLMADPDSFKSNIVNTSHPSGKITLSELLDTIMSGAGSKWSHECRDAFYGYGTTSSCCQDDPLGPFYRWKPGLAGENIKKDSSDEVYQYAFNRWYNIPSFTQIPGIYGQLPTPPNIKGKVGTTSIIRSIDSFTDDASAFDQVWYIPSTYTSKELTDDETLISSHLRSTIKYIPSLNLSHSTVFGAISRLLFDLFKLNVWVEVQYNGGDIPIDPPETIKDYSFNPETFDNIKFILCYGYANNLLYDRTVQYSQIKLNSDLTNRNIDMVKLFNLDHTLVGTAIRLPKKYDDAGKLITEGIEGPLSCMMWEYADGRNKAELEVLAEEILTDYIHDRARGEVILPPGLDEENRYHCGDIIKLQHDMFENMHKSSGWWIADDLQHEKVSGELFYKNRMLALCENPRIALSSDRTEMIFQITDISYTMSQTILGIEERSIDIFDMMEDKLRRITGSDDSVTEITWEPWKADISFVGYTGSKSPYVEITGSNNVASINVIEDVSGKSSTAAVPIVEWSGISWRRPTEYTNDAIYPYWIDVLINVPKDTPTSRNMYPLSAIGPWFNIEVLVSGSKPSLSQTYNCKYPMSSYTKGYRGGAFVFPIVESNSQAITLNVGASEVNRLIEEEGYVKPTVDIPQLWSDNIYFDQEVDCVLAPHFIERSLGVGSIGNNLNPFNIMPYAFLGAIPKGFTASSITCQIWLSKMFSFNNSSYDIQSFQSEFIFGFQWCLEQQGRSKSYLYDRTSNTQTTGSWTSSSAWGGSWHDTQIMSPTLTYNASAKGPSYSVTLSTSLTDKSIDYLSSSSFYFRFYVLSTRGNVTFSLYDYILTASLTPGYELLDEWYTARSHKLQVDFIPPSGFDDPLGQMSSSVRADITLPMPEFVNDDGYWTWNIRRFLKEGDNHIRIRSIKSIGGLYKPASIKLRGVYMLGAT